MNEFKCACGEILKFDLNGFVVLAIATFHLKEKHGFENPAVVKNYSERNNQIIVFYDKAQPQRTITMKEIK